MHFTLFIWINANYWFSSPVQRARCLTKTSTFIPWFPLLIEDLPHRSTSEDMRLLFSAATHQLKITTKMKSNTLEIFGAWQEGKSSKFFCLWTFLHLNHKHRISEAMLLNINAAWESGLPVINTLIPFLQWLKKSQYNIHELSAEIFSWNSQFSKRYSLMNLRSNSSTFTYKAKLETLIFVVVC